MSKEIKHMINKVKNFNQFINENKTEIPSVGKKVDVFNPEGKYNGWGRDEFLYNAEITEVNGQKITVKDINDDEYKVDLADVHFES